MGIIYMAKHKKEEGEVKFNDPKTQAAFERLVQSRAEFKARKLKAKQA